MKQNGLVIAAIDTPLVTTIIGFGIAHNTMNYELWAWHNNHLPLKINGNQITKKHQIEYTVCHKSCIMSLQDHLS